MITKSAEYIQFEEGFIKQAEAEGCDGNFLRGYIKQADEIVDVWKRTFDALAEESGDPLYRYKIANELIYLSTELKKTAVASGMPPTPATTNLPPVMPTAQVSPQGGPPSSPESNPKDFAGPLNPESPASPTGVPGTSVGDFMGAPGPGGNYQTTNEASLDTPDTADFDAPTQHFPEQPEPADMWRQGVQKVNDMGVGGWQTQLQDWFDKQSGGQSTGVMHWLSQKLKENPNLLSSLLSGAGTGGLGGLAIGGMLGHPMLGLMMGGLGGAGFGALTNNKNVDSLWKDEPQYQNIGANQNIGEKQAAAPIEVPQFPTANYSAAAAKTPAAPITQETENNFNPQDYIYDPVKNPTPVIDSGWQTAATPAYQPPVKNDWAAMGGKGNAPIRASEYGEPGQASDPTLPAGEPIYSDYTTDPNDPRNAEFQQYLMNAQALEKSNTLKGYGQDARNHYNKFVAPQAHDELQQRIKHIKLDQRGPENLEGFQDNQQPLGPKLSSLNLYLSDILKEGNEFGFGAPGQGGNTGQEEFSATAPPPQAPQFNPSTAPMKQQPGAGGMMMPGSSGNLGTPGMNQQIDFSTPAFKPTV